jgi:hypothetical protein
MQKCTIFLNIFKPIRGTSHVRANPQMALSFLFLQMLSCSYNLCMSSWIIYIIEETWTNYAIIGVFKIYTDQAKPVYNRTV